MLEMVMTMMMMMMMIDTASTMYSHESGMARGDLQKFTHLMSLNNVI